MSSYDEMRYALLLARRVPDDRKSLPVGFTELGQKAGLWPRSMRRWELAEFMPHLDEFHTWADVLGRAVAVVSNTGTVLIGEPRLLISHLVIARQLAGWEVTHVAEFCGRQRQAVAKWESHMHSPPMDDFITYAAATEHTVQLFRKELP